MTRYCDTGRIECPHLPECIWDCAFDCAVMRQGTRKVKPYPDIPPDIPPVPEVWHKVGAFMLSAIFMVLAVVCILLFFTGAWVWSLLI